MTALPSLLEPEDLTQALLKACVPFTLEEMELARLSAPAVEGGYRRGYAQGYEQAVEDIRLVSRLGYSRTDEVRNILERFARRVVGKWRGGDRKFEIPPQMRQHLPASWAGMRAQVFARDNHACVLCRSAGELHCDHILEVRNGGLPTLDNLRTLCAPCHRARSATP